MESNIPIEVRKIYVSVPVEKELPAKGVHVVCLTSILNKPLIVLHRMKHSGEWFDYGEYVTHWLKEVELPCETTIKLSAANENPYETMLTLADAWNRGLVKGIKAVFNLLKTP